MLNNNQPCCRIRLNFCRRLSKPPCWYLVDAKQHKTVGDLVKDIQTRIELAVPSQRQIFCKLEGLALPLFLQTQVLRDDDTIKLCLGGEGAQNNNDHRDSNAPKIVIEAEATAQNNADEEEDDDEGDADCGQERVSSKQRNRLDDRNREKRKRKMQQAARTSLSSTLDILRSSSQQQSKLSTPLTTSSAMSLRKQQKHIRFDDEGEPISSSYPVGYPVLSLERCVNESQHNVSKVYRRDPTPARPKQPISAASAMPTNGQSSSTSDSDDDPPEEIARTMMDYQDLPSPPVFGDPWKELQTKLSTVTASANEVNGNTNGIVKEKSNGHGSTKVSAEYLSRFDFSNFPRLSEPPKVGSIVAFRLLELSEKFTPEISGYKAGQLMAVEKDSGLVTLEMILGQIEEEDAEQEETSMPKPKKAAVLSWSALRDPRLFDL